VAQRRTEEFSASQFAAGRNQDREIAVSRNSLAYFDEAQGKLVVLEEPVTLRIGSSSADIRLEQKIAVVSAK
jgi:hypothetical protein